MDATCVFIGSLKDCLKMTGGPELIRIIHYRDLCRLILLPDGPNMDCYRIGCHSPSFARKAHMNLYNPLRVSMSNCIAKENGQNGCNMHFHRVAEEFPEN